MISYPKVETDRYSYSTNVYVKPKGSKMFINLQNNYFLMSESIAKIYINKHKYEYSWFNVELNSGDIIKYEITKTYKNDNDIKNKKETLYYIVKKNNKHINESPFPIITGDIYEMNTKQNESGRFNAIGNKNNKI